jgi:hypothetical protein
VKSFNKPLLLLGGGGYTIRNVARCWAYETSVLLDQSINDSIPYNDYFDYYSPDFNLHLSPSSMENANTRDQLDGAKQQVLQQLSCITHAPSVQMQEVPPDFIVGQGDGVETTAEAEDPDKSGDQSANTAGSVRHADHEAEFYDHDKDNAGKEGHSLSDRGVVVPRGPKAKAKAKAKEGMAKEKVDSSSSVAIGEEGDVQEQPKNMMMMPQEGSEPEAAIVSHSGGGGGGGGAGTNGSGNAVSAVVAASEEEDNDPEGSNSSAPSSSRLSPTPTVAHSRKPTAVAVVATAFGNGGNIKREEEDADMEAASVDMEESVQAGASASAGNDDDGDVSMTSKDLDGVDGDVEMSTADP